MCQLTGICINNTKPVKFDDRYPLQSYYNVPAIFAGYKAGGLAGNGADLDESAPCASRLIWIYIIYTI